MSRLMSVAFTEQAVIERRKTVTRRKGWWEDKNGKRLLHEGDRRHAWCKASFELLPSQDTFRGTTAANAFVAATAADYWCATCPGIPHRVTFEAEKCPSCRDIERRGVA